MGHATFGLTILRETYRMPPAMVLHIYISNGFTCFSKGKERKRNLHSIICTILVFVNLLQFAEHTDDQARTTTTVHMKVCC